MIAEFFFTQKHSWIAWSGLATTIGHAFFRAWQKKRLNTWFGLFYDYASSASESGSGPFDEQQAHIQRLLIDFVWLCVPSVLLHPLFILIRNGWLLKWRIALVNSYLDRWHQHLEIENASQRVHEDTQRFVKGLQSVIATLLDSAMTLAVFVPILVDLGSTVNPLDLPQSWLALLCLAVAGAGATVSIGLGWSLVALEVQNQVVEADLRKKLVLVETDNMDIVSPLSSAFKSVIQRLKLNYTRLYVRFAAFSLWLNVFDQGVVVLPYMLVSPLLFAAGNQRVTLGSLTRTTDCFGNVFGALNVVSENWLTLTEFLSVVRRLRQFERALSEDREVSSSRELQSLGLD